MLLFFIFPVLVAGFFACHIHPIHSYKLHRYEGQYLYLKSAELGLKCFAIGFIIALSAHYWLPGTFPTFGTTLNLKFSLKLTEAMKVIGAKDDAEASKLAWFFILPARNQWNRPGYFHHASYEWIPGQGHAKG